MSFTEALNLFATLSQQVYVLYRAGKPLPPRQKLSTLVDAVQAQEEAFYKAQLFSGSDAAPQQVNLTRPAAVQGPHKVAQPAQSTIIPASPGKHAVAAVLDDCAHCALHRRLAHAHALLHGIAEDATDLDAPPPPILAGTIANARREVQESIGDCAWIVANDPALAGTASRLSSALVVLEQRLAWVATCGEAAQLAEALDVARQVSKNIAADYFRRQKAA